MRLTYRVWASHLQGIRRNLPKWQRVALQVNKRRAVQKQLGCQRELRCSTGLLVETRKQLLDGLPHNETTSKCDCEQLIGTERDRSFCPPATSPHHGSHFLSIAVPRGETLVEPTRSLDSDLCLYHPYAFP